MDAQRMGSPSLSVILPTYCEAENLSVKLISYQIDAEVHRRLGNRQDGKPVDPQQF